MLWAVFSRIPPHAFENSHWIRVKQELNFFFQRILDPAAHALYQKIDKQFAQEIPEVSILKKQEKIFYPLKLNNIPTDVVTYSTLINIYGKKGLIDDPIKLFNEMKQNNIHISTAKLLYS